MKPVLFLVFNRPDVAEKALESIRRAQPTQLFVAGDGPRADRPGELEACEQTRRVATQVDWDCEVKTLFRDENLGCQKAVSGAITWFFENVESGIVLEDDCVADQSFFQFCDELLDQLSDQKKVGVITGNNFQRGNQRGNASYYYSKFPHCWGWATWRDRWQFYETQIAATEADLNQTLSNFASISGEHQYWIEQFGKTTRRELDSWAFRWTYAMWKNKLLTATPQVNLVENIGFGDDATHTTNSKRKLPIASQLEFPLTHPEAMVQNKTADAFVARNHFRIRRLEALRKIYRLVKKKLKRQE
jgi:hypothetical protein